MAGFICYEVYISIMLRYSIARRVHFSSAHRYFNNDWSEQKNRDFFGSCYSEVGHGHNYILEAHISGPIDPVTGMIINLRDLDKALKNITDPLDHKHLNQNLPYFSDKVPTTENLAIYLSNQLSKQLSEFKDLQIQKLVLYEGDDLWVEIEYEGMM